MCSDGLDFSTRAFARNLCESNTRWLTAAQDFPRCTDPSYRGRVETGGNLRQGHSYMYENPTLCSPTQPHPIHAP